MNRPAAAVLLLGLACTKSPEPSEVKPPGSGSAATAPDASKGSQVKSYIQNGKRNLRICMETNE